MADQASFARDLGYLDKFLVSLKTHAGTLSEPQRSELLGLLDEEAQRWGRIKGILDGQAAPAAASAKAEASNSPAPVAGSVEPASRGWTVGSLMPKG